MLSFQQKLKSTKRILMVLERRKKIVEMLTQKLTGPIKRRKKKLVKTNSWHCFILEIQMTELVDGKRIICQ